MPRKKTKFTKKDTSKYCVPPKQHIFKVKKTDKGVKRTCKCGFSVTEVGRAVPVE